jgi:hypothetical protein
MLNDALGHAGILTGLDQEQRVGKMRYSRVRSAELLDVYTLDAARLLVACQKGEIAKLKIQVYQRNPLATLPGIESCQ